MALIPDGLQLPLGLTLDVVAGWRRMQLEGSDAVQVLQ